VSCPHCAAPVADGDAFCEACGGDLGTGASPAETTSASTDPAPTASASAPTTAGPDDETADHPRTHLLVPDGRARDLDGRSMDVDTSVPCVACGAAVGDDGFCTVCGHRARTRREHWTETHGDRVGAVCDKGISHARNEDAMATTVSETGVVVLVVCDGVTTAPDSDRASLAASVAAAEMLAAVPAGAGGTGSTASRVSAWQPLLVGSCRVANAEAVAAARALGDPPEPPSCTFVAAVLDGDLVATAWCGDSRAYWLPDDGEGEQLTVDHSLGTQLIRSGLTPEEAEADPRSHTITRWLGADSVDPTPEFRAVVLDRPGWLLVCSDGMWNYASSPAELSALLARAAADGATTATARAESLAAFANGCGGRDNITVALARWEPPLPSTPTAAEGS
jgi:serine/threonine protein phosphatase PrpC